MKNFCKYDDETFDLGSNGLVLIYGKSGNGKTSIFTGIMFALFSRHDTKIIKRGRKSCSVELIFENDCISTERFSIIRTKQPNKLIVTDSTNTYVDEGNKEGVAQQVIYQKFGRTFDCTSYITQITANSKSNSFITMSPADKLDFLEKFAFQGINLSDIKNKCKSLIDQRKDNCMKITSQLELALSYFKELNEPVFNEEIPKNVKQEEVIVKNNITTTNNINKLLKMINTLTTELNDLRILNTYLQGKEENIDEITSKIENLSLEEEYIGDEALFAYKNQLKFINSSKEIISLKTKLDNDIENLKKIKQKELETYEEELKNILENLWIEHSKDDTLESIHDTKSLLKDAKQIAFLQKQINKTISDESIQNKKAELDKLELLLETKQKIKDAKTVYNCPHCSKKVFFQDNKLQECKDEIISECIHDINININDLKKEITSLEKSITTDQHIFEESNKNLKKILEIKNKYDEVELIENDIIETLDYYENYYQYNISLEKRKLKIETNQNNNIFSSTYKMLENDIKTQSQNLDILKQNTYYNDKDILNEEELREIIHKEQNKKEILKQREILENDKKRQQKQYEDNKQKHIEKYGSFRSVETLSNLLISKKEMLDDEELKKKNQLSKLEKIQKFKKFKEEKEAYNNKKEKVNKLENDEKEAVMLFNAGKKLLQHIQESENIAIINIINTIDSYAKNYLDNFLSDNPITIKLRSFKEAKKNVIKAQINLEMYDKDGEECDLSSISGGELARIVLAYTLALNDLFNCPLLLLDESVGSLDEENTANIFELLKENINNKLVIIIAHQVVCGVFDNVINL